MSKSARTVSLDSTAALIVIDVQQGFDDPRWGARNNPGAERNIQRLLTAWRIADRRVIHIQHDSQSPDGAFRSGTPGHAAKAEAAPVVGESVHRKTVNSGFIGTGLERELRDQGITTVVLTGLTTNHCVSTTARMAGNLGFETLVVADATASFARPTLDGHLRPAEEVHAAALSDLNEEFATITNTDQLLDALHQSSGGPNVD